MRLDEYRRMLDQEPRMRAFADAIQERVRAGMTVLEIGAGLGSYSLFAARAGANRVWAIEGGPVTEVARQLAQENELGQQVEFLRGWYPDVSPPGPVDLVIFEDYPPRLLDHRTLGLLQHIEQVALKPGGTLLPARARIWMAPVYSPRSIASLHPLGESDDRRYGLDWSVSREMAVNQPVQMSFQPEEILRPPVCVAEVGLSPAPDVADLSGTARWAFEEPAEVHGLAYWFDLEIGDDVWVSNGPGDDPGPWGSLLLPLELPIEIGPGDTLEAAVGRDPGPRGEPTWMWWTIEWPNGRWKGHEFKSFGATAEELERGSADWTPRLSERGAIERRVMGLADGTRTFAEIVSELVVAGDSATRAGAESLVERVLQDRTR